jgi:hypothetical protein
MRRVNLRLLHAVKNGGSSVLFPGKEEEAAGEDGPFVWMWAESASLRNDVRWGEHTDPASALI